MQRKAAAVSVVSRLVEPQSELGMASYLHQTALPELVGEASLGWSKDRFYRVSDKLIRNKEAIESHIRKQQRELFSLSRSVFLYDLTNTYFEGSALENPKAKRGNSKHKRSDCPQVVVGMVFDQNGFEVGHEIFEGNRNDSKTLLEMVKKLDQTVEEEASLFTGAKPTVIMDAGVATRKNLKLLREEGYSYLVNDSRRGRKKYLEEFQKEDEFEIVEGRKGKSEVKVRKLKDPLARPQSDKPAEGEDGEGEWTGDHLVLCKSAARRKKELAIISKSEEKFIAAVHALEKRVREGRLKDPAKIDEAIGRVKSKHPRVARYYEVKRTQREQAETAKKESRFQISWQRTDGTQSEDDDLLGCYVLRTDRDELDAGEFWKLYITLTRAEDGFQALKSDLGLRPNHHRIEERVDGHIFITVLAYHLLQMIMYVLRGAGDTRSWRTIKHVLQPHCYSTLIIPTESGETHRIRKAGLPDTTQRAIYETLKTDYSNLPVTKTHTKTPSRTSTL